MIGAGKSLLFLLRRIIVLVIVPPRLLLFTTTVLLLPVCSAIPAVESTTGCLAVTITAAVADLLLLLLFLFLFLLLLLLYSFCYGYHSCTAVEDVIGSFRYLGISIDYFTATVKIDWYKSNDDGVRIRLLLFRCCCTATQEGGRKREERCLDRSWLFPSMAVLPRSIIWGKIGGVLLLRVFRATQRFLPTMERVKKEQQRGNEKLELEKNMYDF